MRTMSNLVVVVAEIALVVVEAVLLPLVAPVVVKDAVETVIAA